MCHPSNQGYLMIDFILPTTIASDAITMAYFSKASATHALQMNTHRANLITFT